MAVRVHLLSAAQVASALQGHTAESLTADYHQGAVFLQKGLLDRNQLDYVETLRHFKEIRIADKRFGELAIARGWATEIQVKSAMEVQKLLFIKEHKEVPIGEMLVRQHAITADQREILLQVQHRARQGVSTVQTAAKIAGKAATAPLATPAPPPPEASAGDKEAAHPEHIHLGYKITIAPDHLTAFITLHEGAELPSCEDVQKALRSCSVVYGVDEEIVENLCAGKLPRETALQIAAGEPMHPSKDAVVEYLFDTHPLKAGREGEHDTIDFKDRGDLPQVNPGDVLARKSVASEGKPGKDVHGRTLKPRKPKDVRLSAGNGAKLEADGLTLSAQVSGHPAVTKTGIVSVFPEYRIDGDLGYNTGHVNFNGRVIVSGTVQSGFHVKCGELIANEVEGAEIEATGDVLIKGGVIGSRIQAGGNVVGKYFHATHIEAQGDVMAHTELVDSEVESAGAFHGERCRVLGSRIAAKNGIVVMEVGSDSSPPCVLNLGNDEWAQHQMDRCEEAIAALEQAAHERAATIAALKQDYAELEPRIGALAQVQDKAMLQQRELEHAVKAREAGAQQKLQAIEAQIAATEQELSGLFDQQDAATAEIARLEAEQTEGEAQMVAQRDALLQLKEWRRDNPGHAEIKVQKIALQGTVIKTPHLEVKLAEDKRLLWLEEREITNERGESGWQLAHKS